MNMRDIHTSISRAVILGGGAEMNGIIEFTESILVFLQKSLNLLPEPSYLTLLKMLLEVLNQNLQLLPVLHFNVIKIIIYGTSPNTFIPHEDTKTVKVLGIFFWF